MSIFNRLGNVVRSNANAAISDMEDPEKMLNQMVIDLQQQLVSAKKQVALAIADEKRLAQQKEQEDNAVKDWEQKAMLAVKAGNDELAKQALTRKIEHEKLALGYTQNWEAQSKAAEQLKGSLVQLHEKIEEAKRKKNLLIARSKRADAQKTIADTMDTLSSTSAFDTMQRMEDKIAQKEAQAQATYELAETTNGDQLQKQFDALNTLASDDALLALKQKMGISSTAVPTTSTTSSPIVVSQEEKVSETQLQEIQQEIDAELAALKKNV